MERWFFIDDEPAKRDLFAASDHLKKALTQVPGVSTAKVDLDTKTATVGFDPDKASPAVACGSDDERGISIHRAQVKIA
jgi:Heavy-metal-associated domain